MPVGRPKQNLPRKLAGPRRIQASGCNPRASHRPRSAPRPKISRLLSTIGYPQPRRLSRPARHSQLFASGLRTVGVCIVAMLIAMVVLHAVSQQGRAAASARVQRQEVKKKVEAMLAGIPQHGVILGQPTAPVTLQVFLDLEDHGDGTRWIDEMLPVIIEQFVRSNIVRLEFHSFKTDTLNRHPFFIQQVAALAAGSQNLLWNYVATFMNEQGREFTNYVNEKFVTGIAKQIAGLNLSEWQQQSHTTVLPNLVVGDNNTAIKVGFHDSPSFRIGLTGGQMKNFVGRHSEVYHKYIVRTKPSGERYIAGVSPELQHPVSLVEAYDVKRAVEKLI